MIFRPVSNMAGQNGEIMKKKQVEFDAHTIAKIIGSTAAGLLK